MRRLLFALFFMIVGFLIHAFFFPYAFINLGKTEIAQQFLPQTEEDNDFVTTVRYENGKFNPPVVYIKKTYYLAVKNISKKEQMWLESGTSFLNTPRGYGETEQIRVRLDKAGDYSINNKLYPQAKLKIHVQ